MTFASPDGAGEEAGEKDTEYRINGKLLPSKPQPDQKPSRLGETAHATEERFGVSTSLRVIISHFSARMRVRFS